jgi:catechol 2,3-dioxygenase-like lactoylglutathione lyase family enzyme
MAAAVVSPSPLEAAVLENASSEGLDMQGVVLTRPPPFQLQVNHVSIVVRDAEVSREFYQRLLGAQLINRPAFPFPGYWLWLGNIQLHLIQAERAEQVTLETLHLRAHNVGDVNHLAIQVHDFDQAEQYLTEACIPFRRNFVPAPASIIGRSILRQLFFPDPDGHYIEICECQLLSSFVFGPPPATLATPVEWSPGLSHAAPLGLLLFVCTLYAWTDLRAPFARGDRPSLPPASVLRALLERAFPHFSRSPLPSDESQPFLLDPDKFLQLLLSFSTDGPLFAGNLDIRSELPAEFRPAALSAWIAGLFATVTPDATPLAPRSAIVDCILQQLRLIADPAILVQPFFELAASAEPNQPPVMLLDDYLFALSNLRIRLSPEYIREAFFFLAESPSPSPADAETERAQSPSNGTVISSPPPPPPPQVSLDRFLSLFRTLY